MILLDLIPGVGVLLAIAAIVRLTRPTTDYVDRESKAIRAIEKRMRVGQ